MDGWPPASGHAAFVVHALLTASARTTVALAVILGLITLYAKIILWHWDATLWPGLGVGLVTGAISRRGFVRPLR